jgi:adenylylsulfate kinase-like enzyme
MEKLAEKQVSSTTPTTPKKFKFCYIMRGLPGSGKSTVAR